MPPQDFEVEKQEYIQSCVRTQTPASTTIPLYTCVQLPLLVSPQTDVLQREDGKDVFRRRRAVLSLDTALLNAVADASSHVVEGRKF
jgi:hypothetical protein